MLLTKVIFALLLLSSMAWSASYKYEAAIMQSCGGSITTSNAYLNITSNTSYTRSDYFTNGTKPDEYVFMLQSNNSSISLRAITEDTHTFAGWTVVSGASNCSFTDANSASTTLKIKGKCAIKANRKRAALTLNAGTGGSVSAKSNCTPSISAYEEKISNRYEPTYYKISSDTYLDCNEILKATPSAGYRFDKWTITSGSSNCKLFDSGHLQTFHDISPENGFAVVEGACTIKGSFVKTAVWTIGTATGGTSSPSGSQTVDDGARVKITAIPDETHVFTSWSKATNCPVDDNRSATTYVTVNGDCTIKPAFLKFAELTITAGTGGTTTETSKRTYVSGSAEVSVTATPKSGYRFNKWVKVSGGAACYVLDETAATTDVHVRENCKIQATFVRTYELKLSAGTGGETSFTSKTVDAGSKVDISASINQYGYRFDKWTSSSTSCTIAAPTSSSTKVTVNGACTVTASFVQRNTFAIGPNIADAGTTSPYGYQTVYKGSSNSIKATPKSGYRFDKWASSSAASCLIANVNSASTTVKVSGDCSITAYFVKLQYVDVYAGTGGSTSPSGYFPVDSGATLQITATPESGYRFDKWVSTSTSCILLNETNASTFVKVSDDCYVRADFVELRTFSVGPNIAEAGTVSPSGEQTVDKGSSNSITATPNPGYRLDQWTADNGYCYISFSTSTSASVRVYDDCNVTANFVRTQNVTIAGGTGGSVHVTDGRGITYTASGSITVDKDTTFAIRADEDADYAFDKWVSTSAGCIVADPASLSTTVTVGDDCTVTATFIKTYYALVYMMYYSSSLQEGFLYKRHRVTDGSSVQLETKEHGGYDFEKWIYVDSHNLEEIPASECDCKIEDPNSESSKLIVNGECAVAARLIKRININVSASEGGSVSPAGDNIGHPWDPMDIHAIPDSGYAFVKWTFSPSSCRLTFSNSVDAKVTPAGDDCAVQAQFIKQFRLVVDSADHVDIEPMDTVVNVGTKFYYRNYRTDHGWQLSHFEHKYGKENCPITLDRNGYEITVNGDCGIQPVVVPYFELTEDFKTYYHYYNGEYSSVNVRFHASTEDSTWYYVEMASSVDHGGILENYGDDMWTQNPVSKCVGNMDGLGCYFKSVNEDNYVTISSNNWSADPFSVKYSKVSTDYVDVEYDLVGKIIPGPTIDVGHGMDALIEADDLIGYAFKEWQLMDGDCELDSAIHQSAHVKFYSSRCRYRGVYEADPAANVGVGLVGAVYSNSVQCNYISVADSNQIQIAQPPVFKQVSYVDLSDIAMTFDGDTLQLYVVGDTIWVPIVNEYLRDSLGVDSLPFVVEKPSDMYSSLLFACEVLPDGIMNGDEHDIAVYADYAGGTLSWEYSGPEAQYHDPDAPEVIKLSDAGTGSDSVVRTTERMKIEVQTQDFSDDIWMYDQYLIDFPMTIASTLPVKVLCLSSDDEETLDLTHNGEGVYSITDVAKNEGEAVKDDGILTCAADDIIVTEFVDPFYKTVSRDTVEFGDVVPVEYVFLEEDLVRDIDSVETTEVDFAFSLNTVSPTYDKADTILVALFTDLGDTLWVPAFETDVYSGVFEGYGSFRFVTSPEDQKDDVLDAAMDLEADANRAVIRMQIGKDNSALDSRDSIVVFYEFIPAVSAEIQDKDLDGRADFVRVHFARSILQEQLKIDTLFWGGAEDDGRGVADRDMEISDEGDWIYAALESPFEYGITAVDSTGKKFVSISRNTSSAIQKVTLADKVGPVPVRAEKRPGAIGDEEYLNGKVDMPPDTLVVTLSEPVELLGGAEAFGKKRSLWSKMFQFAESCDNGKVHPVSLEKRPKLDESGTVWTMVIPHEVDIRVGHCLMTNPDAPFEDAAGNAPAIGGVSVEGDDGENYLFAFKADPAVALDTVSAIRVEARMGYKAEITIFDHIGLAVAQFNVENDEGFGLIEWDQRTFKNRRAGTGVYIWNVRFVFADGHKEARFIRTGIRRR